MLALSPFALRLVKASFNAHEDGYAGIQQLAHDANLLFYGSEEAAEGREAYKEKRRPDFSQVPEAAMSARRLRDGTMRIWLMAARPRTLPAAIAPVLVGTAARSKSARSACRAVGAFVAALVGSIFIQIGTNLANDYSDAKRGADTADRLGPVRVTSAGLVTPQRVLTATWIAFGVAVACGIYLAAVAGLVILADRRPLDRRRRPLHRRPAALRLRRPRRGLRLPLLRPGRRQRLLLRPGRAARRAAARALDRGRLPRHGDPRRQQRPRRWRPTAGRARSTLAVRMGRANAVNLYRLLVLGAFVVLPIALVAGEASALPLIGLLALPLAIKPMRTMTNRTDGPSLNGALAGDRRPARRLQPARLARPADRRPEARRDALAAVEVIPYALPFRRALRDRARARSTGARWCCCGCGTRTARSGSAKRCR